MPVHSYDPKKVLVLVGGIPIQGFADGTYVTVERSNDTFTKISGADGVVSRAKSNDVSGSITITLAQTSPSNDVLNAFRVADELTNSGIVPVTINDLNGTAAFASAFGWVRKAPTVEYGKEIASREWVFDCADLDMNVGGTVSVE